MNLNFTEGPQGVEQVSIELHNLRKSVDLLALAAGQHEHTHLGEALQCTSELIADRMQELSDLLDKLSTQWLNEVRERKGMPPYEPFKSRAVTRN
jgi:hypothetical protein